MKTKDYVFRPKKGLNKKLVTDLSESKNEPGWMTDLRLKGLDIFERKPMPTWGADLSDLNPDDIYYYVKPLENQHTSWDEIPDKIKNIF
ncbi:Fe-S cluster assembly protein SufB, partial [Candidatus Dependentiae bacterium]|nr:Fe-S cluster assembly protein SufB [Candidatus Dependentiae bacterium]